jgi:hypothetical protein
MNQSVLKTFAQDARNKLRQLIGARLDYVLTADTAELRQQAAQVNELRAALKTEGRDLLIERVAYTWFNRLAACMMIMRYGINERLDRYAEILQVLEDGGDDTALAAKLELTGAEKRKTHANLNGNLYELSKVRAYVLLRLDTVLSGGGAVYDYPIISIEHVLPQTPKKLSKWLEWFFDQLLARKAEIEAAFGEALNWQRMNDQRACIIGHVIEIGGWRDPEKWPQIHEATADAMARLEKALKPPIAALQV